MNTTYTVSEARENLYELVKDVSRGLKTYEIRVRGSRNSVVLINKAELESWQETLEVMKDFPDLKKDIRSAERDYARGRYTTLDTFLMRKNIHAPRGTKKYAVSRYHPGKSSKRSR